MARPECVVTPNVHRVVVRDIPNLGSKGLHIVRDIGVDMTAVFDGCIGCLSCEKACIENALKVEDVDGKFTARIRTEFCDGIACRKCAAACPEKIYNYSNFVVKKRNK